MLKLWLTEWNLVNVSKAIQNIEITCCLFWKVQSGYDHWKKKLNLLLILIHSKEFNLEVFRLFVEHHDFTGRSLDDGLR